MRRDTIERLLSALLQGLLQHEGENLLSFVLYGSFARGDATKDSDIDLLVVCRDLPRPQFERRARFDQATADAAPELRRLRELGHSAEMSVVLKNEQEALYRSPLYLDMTEDAVLLFDRGGFFASVLEGLRERMRSLGSRRVFLPDGSWYWDLKPDYEPGDRIEL